MLKVTLEKLDGMAEITPYQTFAGFVMAIRKLDVTTSEWPEFTDDERAEIIEISGQISNAVGELERLNPGRWRRRQ